MALEHHFYMDTAATPQEVRDVLVGAGIGFEAEPDMAGGEEGLPDLSLATSPATNATIYNDLSSFTLRPDNGVLATLCVGFRDRKLYLDEPGTEQDFEVQTTRGVMALLRTFPDADAYWVAYDAEHPMLLRRGGRLVLSEAEAVNGELWDAERQPYLALVDLPYTMGPLGPWPDVPIKPHAAAG